MHGTNLVGGMTETDSVQVGLELNAFTSVSPSFYFKSDLRCTTRENTVVIWGTQTVPPSIIGEGGGTPFRVRITLLLALENPKGPCTQIDILRP